MLFQALKPLRPGLLVHVLVVNGATGHQQFAGRHAGVARHKQFTIATDVVVYFCDPRSPWQRGSNENTNGLLRQYLPKGTDLSRYSQDALDAISLKLNTRPRKTLGYMTPAAKLDEVLP